MEPSESTKEAGDRGTSGQCLYDSTNAPGDPHQGNKGAGGDVNMDPRDRSDEGS